MVIVYLALGIASGLIAATVALLTGSGLLLAMIAYLLAGVFGIIIGVTWLIIKSLSCSGKSVERNSLSVSDSLGYHAR